MKKKPYQIEFTPEAAEHLEELDASEQSLVLDAMEDQLLHEPTKATRNRKRMDENKALFVAPWELRIRDLRVYYAVEEAERKVVIVAIGRKDRARVKLGKRWMEP